MRKLGPRRKRTRPWSGAIWRSSAGERPWAKSSPPTSRTARRAPPQAKGPQSIQETQRHARELFRDICYALDGLIAEDDRVVARYTVRAHRSGNPVEVMGMTLFRIEGGKIREAWIVNDQMSSSANSATPSCLPASDSCASFPPSRGGFLRDLFISIR